MPEARQTETARVTALPPARAALGGLRKAGHRAERRADDGAALHRIAGSAGTAS